VGAHAAAAKRCRRRGVLWAEGDALDTGNAANFEVRFGSRSFVRADETSQLSLPQQRERLLQFKVTSGRVSFDMRSMEPGITVEVSAPIPISSRGTAARPR